MIGTSSRLHACAGATHVLVERERWSLTAGCRSARLLWRIGAADFVHARRQIC
jgi:hypothetical protein